MGWGYADRVWGGVRNRVGKVRVLLCHRVTETKCKPTSGSCVKVQTCARLSLSLSTFARGRKGVIACAPPTGKTRGVVVANTHSSRGQTGGRKKRKEPLCDCVLSGGEGRGIRAQSNALCWVTFSHAHISRYGCLIAITQKGAMVLQTRPRHEQCSHPSCHALG